MKPLIRKEEKKNKIKITLEMKEVIQDGAIITYTRLSDYNEMVVNDRASIHNALEKLNAYTKKYIKDNGIGE